MSSKAGVPVLVTGFGPFGTHKVNISWEIAKILPSLNFEKYGIDLKLEEIPVIYSTVTKEIPLLWKKYKPRLVLHLGVTSMGKEITLETLAHKTGYVKEDVSGKLPEKGSAVGEKDILKTTLKVNEVCDKISNSTEHRVPVKPSSNAGRYLCEFTYYTSLNVDNTRTVFIHVPDFNKGFTVKEMALIIRDIILLLIKQVPKSMDEDGIEVTENEILD